MALLPEERAEVVAFIVTFLEGEFSRVLSHYYAAGVAYSSRHPSNINNELRNALTHMARALTADNMEAAKKDMAAAGRHIERFKRDCLKVAVIFAGQNVSQMIRHAEVTYSRFDPNLALEVLALTKRKYLILADEILGDADAAAKWEDLYLDIEKLRERILSSYRLLDTRKYWFPLALLYAWRGIKWTSTAIGIAIIGMALWAVIVPDPVSFGRHEQQWIAGEITSLIVPHAVASSPSTAEKSEGAQPH